ncbi:hypothetical protein AAY473_003215 [Plecturocebus cupreus]
MPGLAPSETLSGQGHRVKTPGRETEARSKVVIDQGHTARSWGKSMGQSPRLLTWPERGLNLSRLFGKASGCHGHHDRPPRLLLLANVTPIEGFLQPPPLELSGTKPFSRLPTRTSRLLDGGVACRGQAGIPRAKWTQPFGPPASPVDLCPLPAAFP